MKKQFDAQLKQAANTLLPAGEFHRTVSCWSCIHFEAHSPDSKGQCRCAYYGMWYSPDHRCTNGISYAEHTRLLVERRTEMEAKNE